MSIRLENVSYVYGMGTTEEKYALKNINLEIGNHELVGIAGHTGSGKSTLLQLFNGLEHAAHGTVYYNDQNIYEKGFSMKELRGRVGLVFQYPEHQLFEATVIKDVEFGPANIGMPPMEVELNSFQALKDVGIGEELLDASPLTLSGGQKRRVALAGVLAMQPEVLVLDEPMAGLDPLGRREVFELLLKLYQERNITIIFVSHSMEDIAEYAGRVLIMNQGEIVLDGRPDKVFRYRKELEQIGLGIPQSALLAASLRERGIRLADGCITVEKTTQAIVEWYQNRKRGAV
ncbi:MAG: energy-coupling factor transporter ATPase [Clostridiaceae bacterium]|nr:energy-coupling factor transporter ATPase [Clostridiaceae bacterium]